MAPRVTRVRERRGGRAVVELDGNEWRTFPVEVVVRAGVAEGTELDRQRARELARERRRVRALSVAARALRPRDRSTSELDQRLERAGIGRAQRAEALGTLTCAGLLDDERFALTRARGLAERGYGDAAIRYDLEQQSVAPELVEQALAELDPEPERAARVADKRGRSPATARHLARKGFAEDSIEAAVAYEP